MKPKSHRDLGLSDEAFLELVDFYRELIRLDEQPRIRMGNPNLIRVLRARIHQLKNKRRTELLQQLEGLEKI